MPFVPLTQKAKEGIRKSGTGYSTIIEVNYNALLFMNELESQVAHIKIQQTKLLLTTPGYVLYSEWSRLELLNY